LTAQIWEEVLGTRPIGVSDNFFALGGHSLLATQVVVRMNSAFRVDIPLRMVFEHPTVAELARKVEELMQDPGSEDTPSIQKVPRDHFMPLSYAQQRLWFIDQMQPGQSTYNVPAAVRVQGIIDVGALERAFSEIVRRHEPLRTRFAVVQGEPHQVIEDPAEFQIQMIDLTASPAPQRDEQAKLLTKEEAKQPFDLGRGPLLRVKLLRLSDDDHALLLTMHHIVCDGWSIGILIPEVSALYNAFSSGAS